MSSILKPFDTIDSPGPIPSVAERFHRKAEEPRCVRCFPEPSDFTIVQVTPEHTETFGRGRDEPGLVLYRGVEHEYDIADLDEATDHIKDVLRAPVQLVEHHADLTYWTAQYRDEGE